MAGMIARFVAILPPLPANMPPSLAKSFCMSTTSNAVRADSNENG